ncbi:glycoside hydrolase family 3 C-terminal domain-containing protein [Bacillus sp. A301a_S52]|nr:glycoside hydrolase family 3 C-terminal domain-containing protein [Bacillus sp. A301a_S52]
MKNRVAYPFQQTELSLERRVEDLVQRLTIDEKVASMVQYQPAIPRLGIRAWKQGTEAAHGVAWLGEATVFPQNIGLSYTWDCHLLKEIGEVISDEARVYYEKNPEQHGLTLWAPTVDMERDPRWGRTEEAYGEDPVLTGRLTTALVKGMQGDHPVYLKTVATLKHFLANNNEKDREKCSASLDPRNLFEYYLQAFKPAFVDGKAGSLMTAYNAINGSPAPLHPLLKEVVKGKWGLDGFIVSDAGDVLGLVHDHGYFATYPEAVAAAIKSGIDSLTDDTEKTIKAIHEALRLGLLDEADLDHALKNAFLMRFRLGEFDDHHPYTSIPASKLLAPEHRQLAYEASQKQIVLLKNDGILPFKKESSETLAVIGPLANESHIDWYSGTPAYKTTPLQGMEKAFAKKEVTFHHGNSLIRLKASETNHYISLNKEDEDILTAREKESHKAEVFELMDWGWGNYTLKSTSNGKYVTVEEKGLVATANEAKGWFVKEQLIFETGDREDIWQMKAWDGKGIAIAHNGRLTAHPTTAPKGMGNFQLEVVDDGIKAAVETAKKADTAVVVLGNNPYINGKECIDRPDICLPATQERLLQAVSEVNPRTVLALVSSYPYAVTWAQDHLPAIVHTSHAGPDLGEALCDVLSGDYNPAGKLSMTWYRSINQLPDMMDYDIIKGKRTYQYFDGDVLYPFGHGLSYSRFSYDEIKLDKAHVHVESDEHVAITMTIGNIGNVDGDEVVQLYVKKTDESRVIRPLKTLKHFKRVHVKSGEKKQMTFDMKLGDLAIWDVTREKYCVETGTYTIMVGPSSAETPLIATLNVNGEVIPPRQLKTRVPAYHYDDYENMYLTEGDGLGHYCVRTQSETGAITFKKTAISVKNESLNIVVFSHGAVGKLILKVDGEYVGEANVSPLSEWQTITIPINLKPDIYTLVIELQGDLSLSTIQLI